MSAISLKPPASHTLNLGVHASPTQRLVANTWNRCGGVAVALARAEQYDPDVVLAVLGIESGGLSFGPDGRMIIRFENHVFFDHWGQHNQSIFDRHFRFDPQSRSRGHRWRRSTAHPWQVFHGQQSAEWEVFELAQSLDEQAAKRSISMGAPQIMGFHHSSIGYASVQKMFNAFAASELSQMQGFFDFVKGTASGPARVQALRDRDFQRFAELYNGKRQGTAYADKMRSLYQCFQEMRRVQPLALWLRSSPGAQSTANREIILPQGTIVTLLPVEPVPVVDGGVWVRVRVEPAGNEGWVNRAFLAPVSDGL